MLMDILRRLIAADTDMRAVVMSACCDNHSIQSELDRANVLLRYGMRISRSLWLDTVRPLFAQAQAAFGDDITLIRGKNFVEEEYRRQCVSFRTKPLTAHLLHHPGVLPQPGMGINDQPHSVAVPDGQYTNIYKTLLLQLTTPSIREEMTFLQISYLPVRRSSSPGRYVYQPGCCIGDYCLKIKVSRDGFVYSGGRMMNMVIMTNCSIKGMTNSTDNIDIVSLVHCQENSYWLHLMAQKVDKELFLLRLFGIVDPKSGRLISIVAWNTEDTGSLEKSLGRPSAQCHGRWTWSKFGPVEHLEKWRQYHVPMCLTGKWAREMWMLHRVKHLDSYCFNKNISIYLAQFHTLDISHALENDWSEEIGRKYTQCWEHIRKFQKQFGYTVGDYLRAEDIQGFGICGLHAELGLTKLVVKYFCILTLLYYEWICKPEQSQLRQQNHRRQYLPQWSRSAILTHFKQCCSIDIYFDGDSPGASSIKASMSCSLCDDCESDCSSLLVQEG